MVTQFYGKHNESWTLDRTLKENRDIVNLAIIDKILNGVSFIHAKGFLHNDIKQNNILLDWNPPKWNTVIVDFGKSRPIRKPKKYHLTEHQQIHYAKNHPWIAPELVAGIQPQSIASDVFSLGMMFILVENTKVELPETFRNLCADCRLEDPAKCPGLQCLKKSLGKCS